jgi:hypothetical protein
MGKIILEFDSVEEAQAAQVAIDGYKWKLAMYDLDQQLRSTVKYCGPILTNEGEATETEMEVADKVRDMIRDIIEGYGLNLND